MKKTFVSNLILLMSVNLLIKPFWILGIDRGVQNHVGYIQYGIYADLFTFSMLLITILDLGLNTYTSSTIAKDPAKLREEFTALATFKLISSVIYIILTLALGSVNGYDSSRLILLFMLCINQVLSFFYTYFRAIVGGLQMFRTDALLSVIDRTLMIIFCSLMLWAGVFSMSITSFILAQTIAYSTAALISFIVIRPQLRNLEWHFRPELFMQISRKMIPYALLSLLMTFYTRLDVILIRKLLPDGDLQNGIYASAYRLLEAANMMAALVAMLLLPIFSKMISSRENLSPLVQFSTGLMLIPAFAFCIIGWFWQYPIISALNHQSTEFSGWVFGVVIQCFLPLATMYVYGTLLTANSNMKTLNLLALIAFLGNISLNLWLIPQYKALGAAITAISTQAFIGITNFYFGKKHLNIRFESGFGYRFLLAIGLIIAAALICKWMEINWFYAAIAVGGTALLSMVATRIIDPAQAVALLKSKGGNE